MKIITLETIKRAGGWKYEKSPKKVPNCNKTGTIIATMSSIRDIVSFFLENPYLSVNLLSTLIDRSSKPTFTKHFVGVPMPQN